MKQQLLLLEDVDNLGRSGDVVTARRGFIRNFLIPQKKALIANKQSLRKQAALKAEREKRAIADRKEAEELVGKLVGFTLSKEVKVDPEGNMYGSVAAHDIAHMLQEEGFAVEKRYVVLPQPLRAVGTHTINLKLKEGVTASLTLEITPEGGFVVPKAEAPSE